MISRGWIICHRCSWITVYVLCCNAQVNLIVIFVTCICISMHYLFCQFLNYNLFTQHVIYLYGETSLVNYGPRSILLHILSSTASIIYFPQALFIYLLQTNILFHMIRLILCIQQTSEIDNLTASWGKVLWLCCVQVSHCCWCRSYALDKAPSTSSGAVAKSASNNLRKWFLSPTGRLNFGFITEGKLTVVLITPYSWGSQLVYAPGMLAHALCRLGFQYVGPSGS
jgi:hypothetical protein